jgi:dipeptidyl aminopeptidase/acylaminoacyl peptidase
MTWDGFYSDLWAIDLTTGERELAARRVQDSHSLSPGGAFVVYFQDGDWHLYGVDDRSTRNLTASLAVGFADEDHDYPRAAPDYGVGGWSGDDRAVFLHDKYDVWRFDTTSGEALCLTEGQGRAERRQYRVRDLDHRSDGFTADEALLLTGFDELEKNSSLWRAHADRAGVKRLREADKYFEIRAKAKDADRILYSEERYDEFGDLWVTDLDFRKPRRLTDLNPQLEDFDLGSAELVEWNSADGIPLQGILIKPAGYDPDRSYPVLLYFYRFFSQRLHRFNDPSLNHRPSFYVYAGSGYAVFLPDVRFEVGRPGLSATKCLVPGVQKLVDMGVADPDAIALHGHSWSGYQAAQVVTQTDIFACAVAGAPVSNMTSAYGGIRYGTGLSRQFQYEKSQSRLGATLWERRDVYIDNSPLFFADRIETPLLMMSGDEDEAVPWTQGIEMYMAMRRLGKPAVFLQYRGEGHHPKKFANKLDYSIRMKEFIDHFCQGAPAPAWWTEGEAYTEVED